MEEEKKESMEKREGKEREPKNYMENTGTQIPDTRRKAKSIVFSTDKTEIFVANILYNKTSKENLKTVKEVITMLKHTQYTENCTRSLGVGR